MKSDLKEISYDYGLIFASCPNGHVEALALFDLDGDASEASIAESTAESRLKSLIFHAKEDYSSLNVVKIATRKENIELLRSVSILHVRLAVNLEDFDATNENYIFWEFSKEKLLEPFCGGFGVIPITMPYAIWNKNNKPRPYTITVAA